MLDPTEADYPAKPAVAFARAKSKYIRPKLRNEYLDSDDLDHIKIKLAGIDISSGCPKDGGLKVLDLKSPSELDAIIEATGEAKRMLNEGAIPPLEDKFGDWHMADFLAQFYRQLFDLLTVDDQGLPAEPFLKRYSPWRRMGMREDSVAYPSKIYWRTPFTLGVRDL
ncbi:hypothetical protein GGR52DRAFT_463779 [Hypoxylon sp. FL1284]|nr:hypothetical protein GGR52DRAFT_463779 [Hypoxylon sp. FL1284]